MKRGPEPGNIVTHVFTSEPPVRMETQSATQAMKTKMDFILFVDDDEEDNQIHNNVLTASKLKIKSECFTEAREALAFLKRCLTQKDMPPAAIPDLIFIDLNMPLFNGFELVEEFRTFPDPCDRKRNMKFVLMTGMLHTHMADLVKQDYSDLIVAVVQKPITREFLEAL